MTAQPSSSRSECTAFAPVLLDTNPAVCHSLCSLFSWNCDKCSLLAQLVEHYLDKVGVSSSSLLETTIYNFSIRCFRRTLLFLQLLQPASNGGTIWIARQSRSYRI